jgi:2-succinyl-6-hydroxy-2,4-cyclohexadiene-1-carboxylate synthase
MASPFSFGVVQGGKAGRPLILFLHGFLGSKNDWDDVRPAFEDSFDTMAIDLPGHGETMVADDSLFRMENCAGGLVQLLDDAGISRCHVVGYSMGGRLAFYLAITYPERFASVVLESTSPGLKTAEEREARKTHDAELARKLETRELESFLQDWYNQPLFESLRRDKQSFEKLVRRRLNNAPSGLAKSLRYMGTGTQPSLWERLLEIRSPSLLIAGEQDRKYVGIAEEVCRLCPPAEMRIISHCGHNVHTELPAEFIRTVKSFLSKNI